MKLVTLFCFLLLFETMSAQVSYGLKAGLNLSDQLKKIDPPGYPSEKLETKMLTGFQAGGFLKKPLGRDLNLSAEIDLSLIGSKTKYTRTDFVVNPDGSISGATTGYYHDKIYLVEIPLTLQYKLKRYYLGLGPTIGFILSSRIDNYQNTGFKNQYYKSVDFSASAIIGYSVSEKIDLNLRYSYGVLDIEKRDYSSVNTQILSFLILYRLR